MNKCQGCGIILQTEDRDKVGYTPKIDNKYCERCFKTIHYNKEIITKSIDNKHLIDKINKLNVFTIFLTDILNLNNLVIDTFKKIKNSKILVINKCELIPDNLKLEHLEENIKNIYHLEKVIFISAKEGYYIDKIEDLIIENKRVVLCGETSSGKTTLINNLMNTKLTTSKYKNTTLDIIKLKKGNYIIYDTPGFIIKESCYYDKINVRTKKLNKDYILSLNDVKINGEGNITLFLSNNVLVSSKKEKNSLDYVINIEKASDILLENGFIYVKDKTTIKTNKKLEIRDSIIK